MSRVTELKKNLNDVVFRRRQSLFLFRLGRDFFLLEQKDSKWIDYYSFEDKHIFLLDKNVSRDTELKNTLTMLLSGVDRICTSSVWEETSFCWKKKDRKWIDNHSFKTSKFSYWTRMCHVSHSLKYTFTMLLSGVGKVRWSSVKQKRSTFCHPWPQTSFCWNKMTVYTLNQFMSMSIQMGFFFAARSQKCTEHVFYIERLWSFYLTKISYFKPFFLVMLVCYIYTCNHCLPRLANCLTVNTSFYKEKFSFKASMFQLV